MRIQKAISRVFELLIGGSVGAIVATLLTLLANGTLRVHDSVLITIYLIGLGLLVLASFCEYTVTSRDHKLRNLTLMLLVSPFAAIFAISLVFWGLSRFLDPIRLEAQASQYDDETDYMSGARRGP